MVQQGTIYREPTVFIIFIFILGVCVCLEVGGGERYLSVHFASVNTDIMLIRIIVKGNLCSIL